MQLGMAKKKIDLFFKIILLRELIIIHFRSEFLISL